jgi:hypothetical protein
MMICALWAVMISADVETNAAAIRQAAVSKNREAGKRPLPLFASWNVGGTGHGYTPAWQLSQIEAGHKILPWFPWDGPEMELRPEFVPILERYAQLRLPISFISTQWESRLSTDKKQRFLSLPEKDNPNVIGGDGIPQKRVSPMGSIEPWYQIGTEWGSTPALAAAQRIHPDPGRLLLLSNNEHAKIVWTNLHDDRRYLAQYGSEQTDDFKRQFLGDRWIERYRALQQGIKAGLPSSTWKAAATCVGYNAFGLETIGRWPNWPKYSLHVPGRFSPWPIAWDGGAPSFYTNNWEMATDYTVFSPQVQCMNWVFMLDQVYQTKPEFWFEMSLWDGHTPNKPNDKYRYYADRNQVYTPERYVGMAKFGMWLLRPRVVREFRGYRETRAENGALTDAVVAAVDEIHDNPVLAEFWREGTLVANRDQQHPYDFGIPAEYRQVDRWFRLSTDKDPQGRWRLQTELPAFSLALVIGSAPNRRWLVYSHSALGMQKNLEISIPDFRKVVIDSPIQGAYWLVEETPSLPKVTRVGVPPHQQ